MRNLLQKTSILFLNIWKIQYDINKVAYYVFSVIFSNFSSTMSFNEFKNKLNAKAIGYAGVLINLYGIERIYYWKSKAYIIMFSIEFIMHVLPYHTSLKTYNINYFECFSYNCLITL